MVVEMVGKLKMLKRVESMFSGIKKLFPKPRAVTFSGFLLLLICFIVTEHLNHFFY